MTVFIDASALVAVIRDEPEAAMLEAAIGDDSDRLTSGLAIWEAARAVARDHPGGMAGAGKEVGTYCSVLGIAIVPIAEDEAGVAIDAHRRYGRGTGHDAHLNMGDCFAYACARTNGARLLYKGHDFSRTDLA